MPAFPALRLVDERAQRLRFVLQRTLAATLGAVLIGASAIVFLNAL